jgi:hypothetical protein
MGAPSTSTLGAACRRSRSARTNTKATSRPSAARAGVGDLIGYPCRSGREVRSSVSLRRGGGYTASMFRARHVSALALAALALLAAPGCGGATIDGVCHKCPKAADTCVADLTATHAIAVQKGCESQFREVLDCADSNGVCDTGGELSASDVCLQAGRIERTT